MLFLSVKKNEKQTFSVTFISAYEETYSEPRRKSKMEAFVKIFNDFKLYLRCLTLIWHPFIRKKCKDHISDYIS